MIVFHHNDADGRCAAAIIKSWYDVSHKPQDEYDDFRTVEMDYKTPVPINQIDPHDTVVIVDFSFKPDIMKTVLAKTKMGAIWCDHHKTAEAYGYNVAGKRDFTEKGLCGAELTWQFVFPRKQIPHWLTLLGDYDSWRMEHTDECLPFYEGLKLFDQSPTGGVWKLLFEEESLWQKIVEEGKAVIKYRDNYCQEMRRAFGFETTIGGQKAYALNVYRFGSQAFGSKSKKYPVCIAFISDGKQYTVSLYSETVDVSEIAKLFGGGGHKGAAGFVCEKLPFAV
ncbi:MAG: DHHA1 domain-containing protein [Candidatus Cloacimonetes bacterium]|jgi:oligoribonuclease NrnB/cAMP/cGMP phosphodiesterase (DHH superfamily)|nr:DHHA1 domain-containing protein [Candidatus Cloacimonadota bacterium]